MRIEGHGLSLIIKTTSVISVILSNSLFVMPVRHGTQFFMLDIFITTQCCNFRKGSSLNSQSIVPCNCQGTTGNQNIAACFQIISHNPSVIINMLLYIKSNEFILI